MQSEIEVDKKFKMSKKHGCSASNLSSEDQIKEFMSTNYSCYLSPPSVNIGSFCKINTEGVYGNSIKEFFGEYSLEKLIKIITQFCFSDYHFKMATKTDKQMNHCYVLELG